MGSAHGERGVEVPETAHGGDTLIQRGADYPFPTHDVLSQFLNHLVAITSWLLGVCMRRAVCTSRTSGNLNSMGILE
jgi:hypothetical protein